MSIGSVLSGVTSHARFKPDSIPGLEAYWRLDQGVTLGTGADITAIADQSGGTIHDLTFSTGTHFQQVLAGFSNHFTKDTATVNLDGVTPGKMTWNGGAIDPVPGEKMNIYVIGRLNSIKTDPENGVRHILQDNSGTAGWIARTQKAALGDKMYQYLYNGSSVVETQRTLSADAVWSPGAGQVLRYEYDGDSLNHNMRAEKGGTSVDWATAGHTVYGGTGYVGHAVAGLCPAMEVAAILIYKSTSGITQGQHDHLVEWGHRTFMQSFDPLTQIDGVQLAHYYRMDQGVTIDGFNNVLTLADQTGSDDFILVGTNYYELVTGVSGFKTPIIRSRNDIISRMKITGTTWNPPVGGRMVIYVVHKPNIPAGEPNNTTRILLQQALSSTKEGWFCRYNYLTASGLRSSVFQYHTASAGDALSGTAGEMGDTGTEVLGITRYQIDDTLAEILLQQDDTTANTMVPSNPYSPATTTAAINLGLTTLNSQYEGDIAAIMVFYVQDRVPQGVHRKITAWLRETFFA